MADDIIFDIIRIGLITATIALLLAAAFHLTKEEEKEYKVIHETKQEIIVSDGEETIIIEKEETKGENEE